MQKALEKMGYDSEVINYIKEEETNAKSVNTNYNGKTSGLKGKIKKAIYCIVQRPNVTKMNNKFTEYRNKYLKQTEVEYQKQIYIVQVATKFGARLVQKNMMQHIF